MSDPFVQIESLNVTFSGRGKPVKAVAGVDLEIRQGEVVALIGESGSGKSVTLRSLLRLHPAKHTRMTGRITVGGEDVMAMNSATLSSFRGRVASMIFQEPLLALDPVYTVGDQIVESICRHEKIGRQAARVRARELFERVRIPSAERRLDAYPHEMSGGMRQRAMIALALACRPKLLLADEPTTALDATVQIQILLLLRELQRDLGLSVIFVTHDIGAAVEIADRIAVMYAGRIVEQATARTLIREARHPYTRALLKGRTGDDQHAMTRGKRLETISGSPPDLAALPPGCAFAPRCTFVGEDCRAGEVPILELSPGHLARCLHTDRTVRVVDPAAMQAT